jgi:hypothetical protein
MIEPAPTNTANRASVHQKVRRGVTCLLILAAFSLQAEDAPRDLARKIAEREALAEKARAQYAYEQSLVLEDFDGNGRKGGLYTETREVIFSATGERSERFTKPAANHLKHLRMTEEDFADLRDIQPMLLTTENLIHYDVRVRGEEPVDGRDCWLIEIKPKRFLAGQRFFQGFLWADQKSYSIVRTQGQAVPPVVKTKNGEREENLFARFTTLRAPQPDGHWFPVHTFADDELPFRTGPVRIRFNIRYKNYQRFGAQSTITFEK